MNTFLFSIQIIKKRISNKISKLIFKIIFGVILRLNILNEVQMKRDLFYRIKYFWVEFLKFPDCNMKHWFIKFDLSDFSFKDTVV